MNCWEYIDYAPKPFTSKTVKIYFLWPFSRAPNKLWPSSRAPQKLWPWATNIKFGLWQPTSHSGCGNKRQVLAVETTPHLGCGNKRQVRAVETNATFRLWQQRQVRAGQPTSSSGWATNESRRMKHYLVTAALFTVLTHIQ